MNYNNKKKNILFINFDIGFNLGYIPEYLISKFDNVVLYSIYFKDSKHDGKSTIKTYKKGSLEKEKTTFSSKSSFPIFIIFSYLICFLNMLNMKIKNHTNTIMSPNPFFAFFGILLKINTTYLVGDIMRINSSNVFTKFFSKITIKIIRYNIKNSDFVWFISESLRNYFIDIKTKNIPITQTMAIQPIKLNNIKSNIKILYIGSFDKSKGIDLIFDVAKKIPEINFVAIGDNTIKDRVVKENLTIYPPKIKNDLIDIIRECKFIGIAPYQKCNESEKYLGDPTKIKQYLSYGMPVLTTSFVEFSDVITKYNAGEVIKYSLDNLITSIYSIYNNYSYYTEGVNKLLIDYSLDIYNDIFKKII